MPKPPPKAPLPPDVLASRQAYETLERELVFGFMRSYRFYREMREKVCPWDPIKGLHRMDFSVDRYNVLYQAIDAFYRRFDNYPNNTSNLYVPNELLANTIVDWTNRNIVPVSIGEQLITEVREETTFTNSLTYDTSKALAGSPAFKDWLAARVLAQTIGKIQSQRGLGTLTIDNLAETVAKAQAAAQSNNQDDYHNAGDILYGTRIIHPCVELTKFPKLNIALGGGLFWGDSTMIAGTNGGGKTILAMQFAKMFALDGYNTVVVTTERKPDEMILRTASDELNIELNRLTIPAGLDRSQTHELAYLPQFVWNSPDLVARVERMYEAYSNRLLMIDWTNKQGRSIRSSFDQEMANIAATGWEPHIIIFDWIGGGLDHMSNKDHLRLYYQEAADCLINHGKATNRIMIMMAQFDKLAAANKSWVKMNMLSECKTMTNNLTNFVGITDLQDKSPMEGKSSRQRIQNLCVDKSTRGPGGLVKVEAAFAFQRFAEVKGQMIHGAG